MPSENVEMFLKTLAPLTHGQGRVKTSVLAHELHISAPSVTQMLQKLAERDYVDYQKYQGVALTEKGQLLAARLIRRYQLLELFLHDLLGLSPESAAEVACRMEHVLTQEVEERLCAVLCRAESDPDHHAACLTLKRDCRACLDRSYLPLSELSPGFTARLRAVIEDASLTDQLRQMGICVGRSLRVTGRDDHSLSLEAEGIPATIDSELARRLIVRVE